MTPLEQLEHSIIADCADAIVAKTILGTIVSWNSAAERLFGYSAKETLGRSIMLVVPPELASEEQHILAKLAQGEHIVGLQTCRLRKDGQRIAVTLTISPLLDKAGNVIGACKIARPTQSQNLEVNQLMALAFRDSLTGLANRTLFRERLEHSMRQHARSRFYGGLLFIDLDDFKLVNDSAGHAVGDQLLQICAHRLNATCRDVDTVTRWGGDEFIVLVEDLSAERADARTHLHHIATELLHELRKPYLIGDSQFDCPPSIGGCLFQGLVHPLEQLINATDQAMYTAKRNGKNILFISDDILSTMDNHATHNVSESIP